MADCTAFFVYMHVIDFASAMPERTGLANHEITVSPVCGCAERHTKRLMEAGGTDVPLSGRFPARHRPV